MLLRRVIEHVKAQNWTAVALDFIIVVVGVLLAIQISNWNESRREIALERNYLMRLTSDMETTIETLSTQIASYENYKAASAAMARAANDSTITDAALIDATELFLSNGWVGIGFNPVDSAFYDLSTSGNLQLIRNADLRNELIRLYDKYDFIRLGIEMNTDWLVPIDGRITYEHDILRLAPRSADLYPDWTDEEKALAVREFQSEAGRLAAGYYWAHSYATDAYKEVIDNTEYVKSLVEVALE